MPWMSPISEIYESYIDEVKKDHDNAVYKAVMEYDIVVDKEELIKALNYDRQQYQKGYADRDAEIVRCKDCKCWNGEYCGDLLTTDRNGFCSWAERKEDGKESV